MNDLTTRDKLNPAMAGASPGLAVSTSYTISARAKQLPQFGNLPIIEYLKLHFAELDLGQIDSVFGFVERSTLYGGRPFIGPELSPPDIWSLYDHGIGLRLPLSNGLVSREEYDAAKGFLNKYHRDGNSVIITNDSLAKWVRQDFPLYKIEASAIKNIDGLRKLKQALKHYDTVVLPAKSNDDFEFLGSIEDKSRIRLFLNAGCAYNCPSKLCYPAVSQMNKYQGAEYRCSQPLIPRDVKMHDFDEAHFVAMGYTRFKLLRPGRVTAY